VTMAANTRQVVLGILLGVLVFISGISLLFADENNRKMNTSKNTTTVYKVVNPDGSISFSDLPQDDAQQIEVAPVTTIPAIEIKQNLQLSPSTTSPPPGAYYQELAISYPTNGAAFYSGNGNIPVNVTVRPELKQGDTFVLLLDGQVMATQRDMVFNLKQVDRGTHTLILKIVDLSKQTIKSTASEFTLHRPSIQ